MSLMDRLRAEIHANGPITVARYMTACLHDPEDGYYATRPRLGADGDFITAPMVSQMFGELIGLWCAEVWTRLGRPARFSWVEMGPGDGTLIGDALRAVAAAAPDVLAAADLVLTEPSPPLREIQRERLDGGPVRPRWATGLDELQPDAPVILIANEVLDCLPARQFVRTERGWAERLVGLDAEGGLAFGLAQRPIDRLAPEARSGDVIEVSPAQQALGAGIGAIIARQGGAALLVDYGRAEAGFGDTLQALKSHRKVPPLERPGEADLTVHADFPAVLEAARAAGAATTPVLSQREFLLRLGIEVRADALSRARPDKAAAISRQLDRLIGPDQMGELFKAACIHSEGLNPPGFEDG
jgi:SAM-dependent MidA family methyltransferase